MKSILAPLAAAFALCACQSTTLPVPDPPPEAAEWERADREAAAGGAYLGVETRENDSGRLDDLFFAPGVRVARVDPNSPADAAGVMVGDVVLAWNGAEVLAPESLVALERAAAGGERVTLEVQRDDSVFEVAVELRGVAGEVASEVTLVARVDPIRSRARWRTAAGGARLIASDDDGPFPSAGVPVGSVVRAIDGRAVHSARELIRVLGAVEAGARVDVEFRDTAGGERDASVRLLGEPRVLTSAGVPVLAHFRRDLDADRSSFVLLDLWIISLVRYTRDGAEREWRFLRWFGWSTGVGELAE